MASEQGLGFAAFFALSIPFLLSASSLFTSIHSTDILATNSKPGTCLESKQIASKQNRALAHEGSTWERRKWLNNNSNVNDGGWWQVQWRKK